MKYIIPASLYLQEIGCLSPGSPLISFTPLLRYFFKSPDVVNNVPDLLIS
jgi:hypothetical protein